jgi:Na+/H+-dicarboxylate symporter
VTNSAGTRQQERRPSDTKKSHLTFYIIGAIIAAVAVALSFPHFAAQLQVGGEIFLRLLQMMVVPLVVASVMSGILGLGDIRKLGVPGGFSVLYYISTTIVAVVSRPRPDHGQRDSTGRGDG